MPRKVLLLLLSGTVVAPLVVMVLAGLGWLLAAMGDSGGAAVLARIALAFGIVWFVALVCLVLAVALTQLAVRDEDGPDDI